MRESVRAINRSVMQHTEGHLDLGALAALGFLALGAAEIVAARTLPVPPWFNLAWWSFRTLTIVADEQEGGAGDDGGGDLEDAGPGD